MVKNALMEASSSATQDEPKWLQQERICAWELYLQMPMPSGRDEAWRKTEIDSLNLVDLKTLQFGRTKTENPDLPGWFNAALSYIDNPSGVLALNGSHLWQTTIPDHLSAKGVIFSDLFSALARYPELVHKYLASDLPDDVAEELGSKFSLMNKAMFNGGLFLYVPKGVEIDRPFVSLISFDNDAPCMSIPRLLVVAEANSRVQLIHAFASSLGKQDGERSQGSKENRLFSLANSLVEIHLGEGSRLDYIELQDYDKTVFSIGETHNVVGKDAKFYSLTLAMGGAQLKSDMKMVLADRGAVSDIQGLVLGDHHEHFSFNTIQEHNAPDTRSNINFKVALKGEATSIYQGIIRVAKTAQKTDAYQSNKNLLLGNEARAESIPKLEILADDVKCSHGATVGPVDREQIFYLMSRGLSAQEAEELIVLGFFRQVLEDCTVDGVSEWIGALVAKKIRTNGG